jgi:hypothetical protein
MAFTENELELVINPAFNRIAGGEVDFLNQSGQTYNLANRHYAKVRDWVLRTFEWNFSQKRMTIYPIQTLTLDKSPSPQPWAAGDIITGISSGISFEVLTVNSDVEYEVSGFDGDLTDAETLTNADIYRVTYDGYYVYYSNTETEAEETLYWHDDSDADQLVCATGYPVAANATPEFEWTYQYDLPEDFIRLVRIYEDSGLTGSEYRWRIEGNRVLTNFDTMNIRYVFQETDPTRFTELFREVLVLRLAMVLSYPTKGLSETAKQELKAEWKEAVLHARVVDAQENNTTGNDYLLSEYASPQTS